MKTATRPQISTAPLALQENSNLSKPKNYFSRIGGETFAIAQIWEEIAATISTNNIAGADNIMSWQKFIEQPVWTIYLKTLPKSRLENYLEQLTPWCSQEQFTGADCFTVRMATMLQKKELSKEMIDHELKLIRNTKLFHTKDFIGNNITLEEAIVLLKEEADAVETLKSGTALNLKPAQSKQTSGMFWGLGKILFLKKITGDEALNDFREKYIKVSGLDVSPEFLKTGTVYAAYNIRKRMCGGFVLSGNMPYRTIEIFAADENKKKLYEFTQGKSYCELNCFWLSLKNRKGLWSYWFWLLFAFTVSRRKEQMLLYGTIARTLANIYGYPRKSKLLHQDQVLVGGSTRASWIFFGRRVDFFRGVLEIFMYKLGKKKTTKALQKDIPLARTAVLQ